MTSRDRRALVREYKERKTAKGVYALRCEATGEAWVGASHNIDAQANSTLFALRLGSHPNGALQAAWTAHGEGLRYEVLERIEETDELSSIGKADLLKARLGHWMQALNARRATG